MKLKITQPQLKNISKVGLFVLLGAIIVMLYPSENKFKYQFEIGKPWTYELITATFDFPIYKSDQQIAKEKEEILKDYTPYFKLDTTVINRQINRLFSDLQKKGESSPLIPAYIKNKFRAIYSTGIISVDEYNKLLTDKRENISCILPNRVTHIIPTTNIYTPRTAYEEVINNAPVSLKQYDINKYLSENMKYDSVTSEISKADVLKNLSLTSGMIQSGERIIDRGEIVTPGSYLVLKSFKIESERRKTSLQQSSIVVIGEIVMILGLITLFFLYIYLFRPRIYDSLSNVLFILLVILLLVSLTAFAIRYTSLSYYMVPFAILPIIIRVFFDARTALFAHIITMLIISFMVDNAFQFLLLQITIGMVAVSSLKDMSQRSQLAQSALYIFISYVLMYLAFECISEGDVQRINWQYIVYFAISSIFLLFAYVLIYLFEKIFNLISSVTLVELTNINSDLMIQFSDLAPGTFQHSMQVSNLATEAAKKINANSLLVRTGSLYHDIGKIKHPEYFIENQMGGKNPLTEIDYEEASKIVINHVTDGIEIAKKYHLPEQIINFITTHHGFGKTKYFYNSFINANPGVKPNEEVFTYPGPLPNNKETAILMMADAVEARSRSLTEYSEKSIDEMVENMIDGQIAEGEFKDAPITFRDVELVKSVFKEKIKNIYHNRIKYPEVKG
ncbi:MAG: HDIG domain-containing protein [Bacteroidota bacterium]|nr:HDIG domain-containing protein [Bacteroidota bacterium]